MNTVPIQNIQVSVGIMICTITLILVLVYKTKNMHIRLLITKGLKKNFISFKEISESQFMGIQSDSGVRFYSTPNTDCMIAFSISYHVDVKTIVNMIRNSLEQRQFKTIAVFKTRECWVLKTQKGKTKYVIDILTGLHVKNSFLIQFKKY